MNGRIRPFYVIILSCLFLISCKEKEGNIALQFTFSVDEQALETYNLKYTNAAGNLYEIDEVKFFISDVIIENENGEEIVITDNEGIHYVDLDIPSTLKWNISDPIPEGKYKTVRFVFGLSPENNVTYKFPNSPENNMAWPDILGGGYHYMQINGRWDHEGEITPFNLHTGRGQLWENEEPVAFIDNHFTITLPLSKVSVMKEKTTIFTLNMNINQWFNAFDLDLFGGAIMRNQEAQELLKTNGKNVFTLTETALF